MALAFFVSRRELPAKLFDELVDSALYPSITSKDYTDAVSKNLLTLKQLSKASKIPPSIPIEDSVSKRYFKNDTIVSRTAFGVISHEFIMLSGLKTICDKAVKNKVISLPKPLAPVGISDPELGIPTDSNSGAAK